jgi:2-polyprenyl-3-methyl-5-hydroxy-6-metoxy-1,4-benzoquinol methylase
VKNLEGLRATFVNAPAYGIDRVVQRQFDVVVSFSVLEHVYRRGEYLRAVRACLKPEGHVLLNYDSGHFLDMTASSRLKDVARRVLARLGVEQYFQAAIPDRELHRLVDGVGLHCVDARFFNAYSLKDFYKMTPPASRDEFMHAWLAFELELNALGIPQTDVLNRCFATRNLILVPG